MGMVATIAEEEPASLEASSGGAKVTALAESRSEQRADNKEGARHGCHLQRHLAADSQVGQVDVKGGGEEGQPVQVGGSGSGVIETAGSTLPVARTHLRTFAASSRKQELAEQAPQAPQVGQVGQVSKVDALAPGSGRGQEQPLGGSNPNSKANSNGCRPANDRAPSGAAGKQQEQRHQQQQQRRSDGPTASSPSSLSSNYISSLVNKSSILLHALKLQYTSLGSGSSSSSWAQATGNSSPQQTPRHRRHMEASSERGERDTGRGQAAAGSRSATGNGNRPPSSLIGPREPASSSGSAPAVAGAAAGSAGFPAAPAASPAHSPARPPPPLRSEVGVAEGPRHAASGGPRMPAGSYPPLSSRDAAAALAHANLGKPRRHALQEQSLERDAALSLKARELKHKRTSSIKSALRHAHLNPLAALAGSHSSERHSSAAAAAASNAAAAVAANTGATGGSGAPGAQLAPSSGGGQVSAGAVAANGHHHHGHHERAGANSMPYELFEPPVTQRTFQRTKRRGAMLADPKRQMSADTIGLRQLTDEYLHNAGVKPMSNSGQCSLVALASPPPAGAAAAQQAAAASGSARGLPEASLGAQPEFVIQSQLYMVAAHRQTSQTGSGSGSHGSSLEHQRYPWSGSQESLSGTVAVLPGSLPWQSDVSIQCELLRAPPAVEPYETTGDLLNTLAGPFRASGAPLAHEGQASTNHHQLSATLKRGLTAISSHHLSPSAPASALNVVGNLKKSLSNTLDISAAHHHLHSQDSLPAYSSLQNEPSESDDELGRGEQVAELANGEQVAAERASPAPGGVDPNYFPPASLPSHAGHPQTHPPLSGGGVSCNRAKLGSSLEPSGSSEQPASGATQSGSASLIGHLTSKLTRQPSSKFSVSRKGLQRALSFDCRGYKRLEQAGGTSRQSEQQRSKDSSCSVSSGSKNFLTAKHNHQHQNRSTLNLSVDQNSPRPYMAQSASQVDFQLPLLPYHKMQQAIVAQRRLDPPPSLAGSGDSSQVGVAADEPSAGAGGGGPGSAGQANGSGMDADELLCAQAPADLSSAELGVVEPERLMPQDSTGTTAQERPSGANQLELQRQARGFVHDRKTTPPRLVLDIPTIAAPTTADEPDGSRPSSAQVKYAADDDGGEEVCTLDDQDEVRKAQVIVCLASPNISIQPPFNGLSPSPSFCIDAQNKQSGTLGQSGTNQLTASDVFSRSKIKRPSTMMVSDAMNQVAQALHSSGSQAASASSPNRSGQAKGDNQSQVLRSRRQAIVPPKLATDANSSDEDDSETGAQVGKLVDVGDDDLYEAISGDKKGKTATVSLVEPPQRASEMLNSRGLGEDEEARLRVLRRKRSGGTAGDKQQAASSSNEQQSHGLQAASNQNGRQEQRCSNRSSLDKRLSGSQTALPTFYIEPSEQITSDAVSSSIRQAPDLEQRRPDSQMTNVDSIVSSGSSANLSLSGKRGEFTVTSPGGLTVSFGSSRGRRRSSIAVIPQMQICPGDLLVYSKQLIDRMNQSDETEPPQFLTIDDKKGKNIWSSFKLFDNRTMKARNELLCSLEDVLASLQPSTFVDEQLSHYKGMLWNEFLYETESRRSASSESLVAMASSTAGQEPGDEMADDGRQKVDTNDALPAAAARSGSIKGFDSSGQSGGLDTATAREPIKATMSSGGSITALTGPGSSGSHRARDPTVRSISSRFKEKPKLKRGQTVDSVFRIPLIPSSPLKHAQQHQQTPTAHLEDHELITIEDDERSSPGSGTSISRSPTTLTNAANNGGGVTQRESFSLMRRNRSSSTRSRSGSNHRSAATSSGATNALTNHKTETLTSNVSPSNNNNNNSNGGQMVNEKDPDSSFEIDDTMDLQNQQQQRQSQSEPLTAQNKQPRSSSSHRSPYQMMQRQSSLSTLSSTITRTEQKRQRALWDLFQSECAFFFDHLMTLKNVYMEPLKKIQVEGFAMFADPDVLFGNLDELCCGVYDFCKEFLYIIMRTLKTRPEELNATDVLIKLYKKNPKIDHLRGVYHRYTLNYINALTYLESLRRQVEFVEFEKWSTRDIRCKKLQLTDLLVAPVQHIMRVPIILKDIESHTENPRDREEIRAILAVEEASLRELDDKMRWLKNFERLLEIQKNINWPNVLELDPKLFIPEFLKEVLSKQPCEKLIVSPRRQIVHEGTLSNLDLGRACDMHVILFDDMLLLTRRKKGLTKKASTVCKTNSGGSSTKDDGSFKYIVYKQPLSLDRFYVHDVQQVDAQSIGLKHLFLLIVMNRFQQITSVHSFSAPNDDIKQTWLFKIKKTIERWKRNLSNAPIEQPIQQEHVRIQPVTTNLSAEFENAHQGPAAGPAVHQPSSQHTAHKPDNNPSTARE